MDKEYFENNKKLINLKHNPYFRYCNEKEYSSNYYLLQKDYGNISFFLINSSIEEPNVGIKDFIYREDGSLILLCFSITNIYKGNAHFYKEEIFN